MTTTAENHTDTAGTDEDTVVVPRPQLPQPPHGYAPYGAPGYGQPYGQQPHAGPYGPQPQAPLTPGFAAGFPAPAPRRGLAAVSRNTWIAVAAAVTLIIAMVAVVVLGTSSTGDTKQEPRRYADPSATAEAAPANPGKVLGSADLPQLLLNPDDIAGVVGKPVGGAKISKVYTALSADTLVAGSECLSLAWMGEQASFQGTGFTGMRQVMTRAKEGTPQDQDWVFQQTVLAYPSAQAAQDVIVATTKKWTACEGKSWAYTDTTSQRDVYWNAGQVQVSDDAVVTAMITQENGDGWACYRGMTDVANVVTDFTVCGLNPTPALPAAAAAAIARKIPTT